MQHWLKALCLTLCFAFVASSVLHAPADVRDLIEHQADEVAAHFGVEVSGHAHLDCGQEAGGDTPAGHHHHNGDNHSGVLLDRPGAALTLVDTSLAAAWPQDRVPDGLAGSGPDQPPKRLLTLT